MSVNFEPFKRVIPVGERALIHAPGTNIAFFSSTGEFKVQFDDGNESNVFAGLQLQTEYFENIAIVNNDSVEITVEIGVADGLIRDSRLQVTTILATRAGTNVKTLPAVSVDATAALAAPANTDRTELHLDNKSAVDLFYGDDTVTAANGQTLLAGEKLILDTSGDVYLVAGSGSGFDVRVMEVGK